MYRQQPESKKIADDYLGDMDLPSSESESDGEAPVVVREERKDIIMAQVHVAVVHFAKEGSPTRSLLSPASM